MIAWLKKKFAPKALSTQQVIDLWDALLAGGGSFGWATSGRVITESAAMRASAVFACVRLIAGAVSCSPCLVYRGSRYEKVRTPAPDHRLSPTLLVRPNPFTTAATFWKAVASDKLLHGNAFAVIRRNPGGKPVALERVRPESVHVFQYWELGLDQKLGLAPDRLLYEIVLDRGGVIRLDQDDMIHVPNMGWDGKLGLSTLRAGADAMAGLLDAQEFSGRFFKQGASFQFALTFPQKVSRDKAAEIREYFAKQHGGVKKAHLPPVLSEGGDIKPMNMNSRDAQLLESREFSVIDVCRYFGVPPVMVGETTKTTSWGSGVEQMARWFSTFTLADHFTAIEQELEAKLFAGGGHFPEFDESELLRGDTKTQFEAYKTARGSMQEPGILTVNEIRRNLGYGPVDGGDEILRPARPESTGGQDEPTQQPA